MSEDAQATITTNDDGAYKRTAIVLRDSTSVDLLLPVGLLVARMNLFTMENWLGVDVIDVDNRFTKRAALTFDTGKRHRHETDNNLVAVDFRR